MKIDGTAFAIFHSRAAWYRAHQFARALAKRYDHVETVEDGYVFGCDQLSYRALTDLASKDWDGTPEHAYELVGDYFEGIPL